MRNPVRASCENWLRRLVITLALTVLGAASPLLQAQCNLDVDANGQVDALTDGLLIMRAGMGLTGIALTQGALAPDATRTDPTLILNYINANKPQYDLDGNGAFAAPTDAMMMLRYMFGHGGTALTDNAVGPTSVRPDWTAVSGYLQSDCGVSPTAAQKDAARLLTQATWGPKYTEIFALAGSPSPQVDNWITNQFSLPRLNHIDWILARFALGPVSMSDTYESFWRQALAGDDQLRQRVAFALSQILVVSNQKDGLDNPWMMSGYMDTLERNAFGNYRTLLEEMTKTPGMAFWLDHLCNDKESPAPPAVPTRLPNENYAREIMQLFTIGTLWLNADGTTMLDNQNHPIQTYDQTVVQGFAKVFTGWSYSGSANWCQYPAITNNLAWYDPLIPFNNHHSYSAKTLLALTPNGINVTILAATLATANAQADLTTALDNIFNHPNIAPYVSKALIKFLVTSNPSPQYVGRVSAKFANNGSGVRGDMKSVIRAILTDTEARDLVAAQGNSFGKLREPAVRFGNLMRTFHASAASTRYNFYTLGDPQYGVNEQPLSSPTVFNFYGFDYSPQGVVADNNLLGPEFEVTTSTAIIATSNNLQSAVINGWGSGADAMILDFPSVAPIAATPAQIVDYLNLVMTNGAMTPATRSQLVSAVALIPQTGIKWQADRWKLAIYLLSNSPEYVIQR